MPSCPTRIDTAGAVDESIANKDDVKPTSQERRRQSSRDRHRSRERKRQGSRERQNSQEKKRESSGERQSSQEKTRDSSGERQGSPEKRRQNSRERRRSRDKKRQSSRDRQTSKERNGEGEKGKGKGKGKPANWVVCNSNVAMIAKTKRLSEKDPLLDGRRLRGFVKHYCPLQGLGMIRCEEHKLDVILHRLEADACDATSGATASFYLERDEDGKPTAREVRVLLKGTAMKHRVTKLKGVEIDWDKTYVGTVKVTWNGGAESIFVVPSMQKRDTGGAFIGSDEAFKVFGDDIWAYPCRIPGGLKAGDMLKFKVEIDHFWSYPVAVNIQRVQTGVAESTTELEVDGTGEAQKTVTSRRKSRSPSRERSDSRSRKANKQPKPKPADVDNDQHIDTGSVQDIVASLPTPNRTSMQKEELEEQQKSERKLHREEGRQWEDELEKDRQRALNEGVLEAKEGKDGLWYVQLEPEVMRECSGQYFCPLCEKHLHDSTLSTHLDSAGHRKRWEWCALQSASPPSSLPAAVAPTAAPNTPWCVPCSYEAPALEYLAYVPVDEGTNPNGQRMLRCLMCQKWVNDDWSHIGTHENPDGSKEHQKNLRCYGPGSPWWEEEVVKVRQRWHPLQQKQASNTTTRQPDKMDLPEGWTAHEDDGRIFYFHAASRTSTWEVPVGQLEEVLASEGANHASVDESIQESKAQGTSHFDDTNASVWKRYQMEDGENYWWWCELDNDCFLEANPGPWTRYLDPDTERHYWWKSEDKWFWI